MPVSTEAEQLRTNMLYTKQALVITEFARQIKAILYQVVAKHPDCTIRTGKA